MRQVYSPANSAEAHMLVHMLDQAGIAAHLHGEGLQGAAGELPVANLLQILVADEDYDKARALIAEWERTAIDPDPPERVARRRYPILLIIIVVLFGFFAGWWTKSYLIDRGVTFTGGTEEVDQNGDGRADYTYFYSLGARYPSRAEADNDHDGRIDQIIHYDGIGTPIRASSDEDYDGRLETETTYEFGLPLKAEVDANGNGVAERTLHFEHGYVVREDIFDTRVGRMARVNFYDAGILVRSQLDLDRDGIMETERTFDRFGEIVGAPE